MQSRMKSTAASGAGAAPAKDWRDASGSLSTTTPGAVGSRPRHGRRLDLRTPSTGVLFGHPWTRSATQIPAQFEPRAPPALGVRSGVPPTITRECGGSPPSVGASASAGYLERMSDPKRTPLPLVGKLIKKRLVEFGQQMRREWRDGYDEFGKEIASQLDEQNQTSNRDASSEQTLLSGVQTAPKE